MVYSVANFKKPHTCAEKLILPTFLDIVLWQVPVSKYTISRKIRCIVKDLHDQLIEQMKSKEISRQLDDAIDFNKDGQLFCKVRLLDDNIIEDLFFCKSISARA